MTRNEIASSVCVIAKSAGGRRSNMTFETPCVDCQRHNTTGSATTLGRNYVSDTSPTGMIDGPARRFLANV